MHANRSTLIGSGLVAVLATCGCIMPDQVNQIQQDVADLHQQLQRVQRSQEQTEADLDALSHGTRASDDAVTREDLARLGLQVDRVAREVGMVDEKFNDLNGRLDRFSQDLQQTRALARSAAQPFAGPPMIPVGGDDPLADPVGTNPLAVTDPPPSTALPDPEQLYNTAYADFSKGNFALAISGFEEYQQLFAESPLADNALYWIGECHFSQGDYVAAIDAFDRVLAGYPRSDKAEASNLKKALAFLEQNQVGQAIVQLRFVLSEYPGSDEARIARDKLASLGSAP